MPRQRTVSDEPRTQRVALRALNIIKVLRGHTLTGLSNQQIAEAINEPASAVTLSLNSLERVGFVTRLENGRYAHSVLLLQIAQAHADHISRMQGKINEINARIHAGSQN